MKLRGVYRKTAALTLVEVLVVILVLLFLAALLLPMLAGAKKSNRIRCTNNLKQIGLAFEIWSGDHANKFPMTVSAANGGAMESVTTGNAVSVFQVMSNELSTPKVLCCQEDREVSLPKDLSFSKLTGKNVSYFVGADVENGTNNPRLFLAGDDNLSLNGNLVQPGLLQLSTNLFFSSEPTAFGWTSKRHRKSGNILFADGYVDMINNLGLRQKIIETGLTTNCLAIP